MKRTGKILFCFVPFLLAEIFQNLFAVTMCGLTFMWKMMTQASGTSMEAMVEDLMNTWSSGTFGMTVIIPSACLYAVCFGYWYHRTAAKNVTKTAADIFNGKSIAGIAMLALGMQYLISYIISFVAYLAPAWMKHYESLIESSGIGDSTLVMLLYSVVIGPIAEELIFRGVTLHYAKKCMPFVVANLFQAILFGVYHMNMIQGIYAAILGLFLGYVCTYGGSIYLSILFHMIFNLLANIMPDFMSYTDGSSFFFMLWLTVGVLLTLAGIIFYRNGILERNEIQEKNSL